MAPNKIEAHYTHVVALGVEGEPAMIVLCVQEDKRALFLQRWWVRLSNLEHKPRCAITFEISVRKMVSPSEALLLRLYEDGKLMFRSYILTIDESYLTLEYHWAQSGKKHKLDREARTTGKLPTPEDDVPF